MFFDQNNAWNVFGSIHCQYIIHQKKKIQLDDFEVINKSLLHEFNTPQTLTPF